MPKSILDCNERRRVTESRKEVSREDLSRYGRELTEAGSYCEALDFYKKAEDLESISRLSQIVLEEGDYFLFNLCCQALKKTPSEGELLKLAEAAEKAGLLIYAEKARDRQKTLKEESPKE
jgi:hypothetical protein